MAAVLVGGPTALLSHLSALRLWGLSREGGPMPREALVHITVIDRNRGRCEGIRVHRVERLDDDERSVRDGIPVTAPGRTLVDAAAILGSREVEGLVARTERDGLLDRRALLALVGRYRGRPGIPVLREVLEAEGGPALLRSEAEARFLSLVRSAGLLAPEVNVGIGPYEIDFLWRRVQVAVEVDGFRYHRLRRRFEGDREKDAWLLARGITVLRLSWRQITDKPVGTAVQVAQALVRAGPSAPHV